MQTPNVPGTINMPKRNVVVNGPHQKVVEIEARGRGTLLAG